MTLLVLLKQWWKAGAGVILGALLCWPLATCSGKAEADRAWKERNALAADKAHLLGVNAQLQADSVDLLVRINSAKSLEELRGEIDKAPVGGATSAVLDKLRQRASEGGKAKASP